MASPGRSHRKGISLLELAKKFPDNESAQAWFEKIHWPDGKITCLRCESEDVYRCKHKTMPFRCRTCKKYFSVKTGTAMQSSNVPLRKWVWAIYLEMTSLKGVSSMKLHRDIGVAQSNTWHVLHRLREGLMPEMLEVFEGPVEADEAYFGGKRKNMSNKRRKELEGTGRGTVGKATVVGIKDRGINQFQAQVVTDTTGETLTEFVNSTSSKDAVTYTDDFRGYQMLKRAAHKTVKHSIGEYVNEETHINGMESFWALLKRGYYGTYHRMSPKHLQRYVNEFVGRHNIRDMDTIKQMESVAKGFDGKRLTYKMLTRKTKLDSTAM